MDVQIGDFIMGLRITTEQVAQTHLFEGFTLDEVKDLLSTSNMLVKHCRKGDYIYLAGDVIEHLCLVVTGTVQILREDIFGDKSIIGNINAGWTFGADNFAFSASHSPVSYVAVKDCDLLLLPFNRMTCVNIGNVELFSKYFTNIVKLVAQSNFNLITKLDVLSKKSLRSKIMTYLEQEAAKSGSKKFLLPFNRTELANYLDADRSAMTRELFRMKHDGYIAFEKNVFSVLKPLED